MTWSYRDWIVCSVGISVGIFIVTIGVLWLLKWLCDTLFYDIVKQLLNIERCFLDAHHRIIQKDDNMRPLNETVGKYLSVLGSAIPSVMKDSADISNVNSIWEALGDTLENNTQSENETPGKKKEETSPESKSHPECAREVLNVYGRYMSLNKRGTFIFLLILTTLIISGALIAAFNSIILATSTVYQHGPCPPLGPMECFCGNNYVNFSCDTGELWSCPLDVNSGVCFRWVARDLTTSDVTTQLGVTTGLLIAFGQIAQALIRIYLIACNKRLGIATGIHRIAAKTIGINKVTARTRCCCCNLCCHCSVCNCGVFKHPLAVAGVTIVYFFIPLLIVPAVVLLYYYQLTVTALTFVILIVLGILCILSIVWIMVQETEASSNVPGGWKDVKELIQVVVDKTKQVDSGKGSPIG